MSVQKVLPSPFHCKPRPSGVSLESPGLENIPQFLRKLAKVAQNNDARRAFPATLSVFKFDGHIFRPRRWKPRVRSFYLCPFLCKARASRVILESPGLESIPQVPGNPAKVAENQDARKAVSATLSVLKLSRAIFRPTSSTPNVRSFCLCTYH